MNNKLIRIALVAATGILGPLASQSAFAQTFTNGDLNNLWNDNLNWNPTTVPDATGATANLTSSQVSGNVDLASTPETVGTLNIGSSAGAYNLESSGGATLTLNNGGSGAAINEVSTAVGDTISAPLVIADAGGLNITDSATSGDQFYLTGGITGTGNLTVTNNASSNGGISFQGNGFVNNVGTITTTGTSGGYTVFRDGVGSNVTTITQDSNNGILYFAGNGIAVASGGTTIVNNSSTGQIQSDGGTGFTGTGNVTLENNSSSNYGIGFGTANNVGQIIVNGTGTSVSISNSITSNVTGVTIQSGSVSGLTSRGSLAVNAAGTTLTNNSSTGAQIEILTPITGTGNVVIDNDGTTNKGVQVAEQSINNTGYVINSGTGAGTAEIGSDGNTSLGSNLQGVIENSTQSALELRLGDTSPSSFTGILEVQQGTMYLSGATASSGDIANASKIIVGDTAAHGATAFLYSNFNENTMTLGSAQTFSGFGTFQGQSGGLNTVSGSTLAPGSTGNIGKLTMTTGLSIAGGTNLTFILGSATALPTTSLSSMIGVGGTLTLASGMNLDLSSNAGANSQGSIGAGEYELFSYNGLSGASAGDITSLFNISGPAGYMYDITDTGTSVGQIDLTVTTPEPASWTMLLGALGILFGVQKLRRRTV